MGSTLALVNSAGGVTASYSYAPFGKTTIAGTSSTTFQFTGRENDSTGLYYYRARYYSPTYQRFIAQDPLDFEGAGPNLYVYAADAPIVFGDPLGLWTIAVGISGSGISGPLGGGGFFGIAIDGQGNI